jgi:hypothetical protein
MRITQRYLRLAPLLSLLLVLAVGGWPLTAADSAPHKKNAPCATDLASCPARGCAAFDTDKSADEREADGLVNMLKRTKPGHGTAVPLTFDDFAKLQSLADATAGQGKPLSLQDRAKLRELPVSPAKSVSEGDLVELRGFVIQDSPRPKPAGPESVNCRLTKAENNDIHIPIVEDAEDQEFAAIVVEMIPQDRPDGWNSKKLKKAAKEDRPVIVRGRLFYDNKHLVNGDQDHDNGEPKRFSLWEIHPVSDLYVCIRADRKCGQTLAKPKDWKKLQDF